jgi:hypothetical protein
MRCLFLVLRATLFAAASMCADAPGIMTNFNLTTSRYNLGNGTVVTGQCAGNTNTSEDFTCPPGYTVKPNTQGAPTSAH